MLEYLSVVYLPLLPDLLVLAVCLAGLVVFGRSLLAFLRAEGLA